MNINRKIFVKRFAVIALVAVTTLCSTGHGRSNAAAPPPVPLADHHTHLWSLAASTLVTEPLMPVVELPEQLKRLLLDKERFGGKDKNPTALADLYTKDLLVLNPSGPTWLRGERALSYVTNSTVINRLLPTAYEVDGSAGYVAGYEVSAEGTEYLSNFHYVVTRRWRS